MGQQPSVSMLNAYKIALGPLLLLQGRSVHRTALRLPEAAGPRWGVAGALAHKGALKVLFVGDSSAAGVGVEHQDHALATQTATFLAERVATRVEWQLVAKTGINTNQALDLVNASELNPADLLVTALGVNDVTSQRSPVQFLADYKALVEQISKKTNAQAVIVSGLPPPSFAPCHASTTSLVPWQMCTASRRPST